MTDGEGSADRLRLMPDTSALMRLDDRDDLLAELVAADDRLDLLVTHVQRDECKRSGRRALSVLTVTEVPTAVFVLSGEPSDGKERMWSYSRLDHARWADDRTASVYEALRTGGDGEPKLRHVRDAIIITTAWFEDAVLVHCEGPDGIPARIARAEDHLGFTLDLIEWDLDDLARHLREEPS